MMLKPDTPESKLLVDWVEGGENWSYWSCIHAAASWSAHGWCDLTGH